MTTFTIPASTFQRLSGVAAQIDETIIQGRDWARCVRIEHRAGRCIAIASYGPVLAGEFIGDVDEADGTVCVTVAPALLEMVRQAALLDENLIINQAPGWTVVTTSGGTMYPGNGEIDGRAWPDWRSLVPSDLPTKNNGCFSFSGARMARLCASSPTGTIRCAKNIDALQPTIVRDTRDDNWFGIFMVNDAENKQTFSPATIPDFLK